MQKKVIWIIGSNSSGKTTLAKNLHYLFNREEYVPFRVSEDKLFTLTGERCAHMGKLSREGACSGTDSLKGMEQFQKSFSLAKKEREIIFADGVMATGSWINFLFSDPNDIRILIHLEVDEETNIERLRKRRAEKAGIRPEEVEIKEKTYANLYRKRRNFLSLFKKGSGKATISLSVNTIGKSKLEVTEEVANWLNKEYYINF